MIFGAHVIVYSTDATADRAFFGEILGFSSVDAGRAWSSSCSSSPTEAAVHPTEEDAKNELFFMCDDLEAEMRATRGQGVRVRMWKRQGGAR